jgi:alkaline phosphatase D
MVGKIKVRWWVGLVVFWLGALSARANIVAGPMIGHVTENSVRIWMQLSTPDEVQIRAYAVGDKRSVGSITVDVEGALPFVCDIPFTDLEPDTAYRFEISVGDKPVEVIPELVTMTAPLPGTLPVFSVAGYSGIAPKLLSDAQGKALNLPVLQALTKQRPRLSFMLGNPGQIPDKMADLPPKLDATYRVMINAQRQVRLVPGLQQLFRTTPMYRVAGAGDYGPWDESGESYPFLQEGLVAFQRYWPNPTYGTNKVRGNFTTTTYGDVDFFLLDAFTQRIPVPADKRQMFGPGQIAWLQTNLKASKATFKVLVAGVPLLGEYPEESGWAAFPEERTAFIQWLFAQRIPGVIMLSGGRASRELSCRQVEKKGREYTLYELSTGYLWMPPPADATTKVPNPNRKDKVSWDSGFGLLEFAGPKNKRHVNLSLRDAQGQTQVELRVFAEQLETDAQ